MISKKQASEWYEELYLEDDCNKASEFYKIQKENFIKTGMVKGYIEQPFIFKKKEKETEMNDIYKEITEEWEPISKMENASPEVYRDRIEKAFKVELPHNILTQIPYIAGEETVEYEYKELIALCPITFLPDLYKLTIRFIPDKYVPELKSLKFYLMDYIKIPISHEHLANKIYHEFDMQIKPKKMFLYLKTNIRGGIETNIEVGEIF